MDARLNRGCPWFSVQLSRPAALENDAILYCVHGIRQLVEKQRDFQRALEVQQGVFEHVEVLSTLRRCLHAKVGVYTPSPEP